MVFSQWLQSTCPGSMCLTAAVIPLCCDWEAWVRMLGWDGMGWFGEGWLSSGLGDLLMAPFGDLWVPVM